jgi:hypothetical protein
MDPEVKTALAELRSGIISVVTKLELEITVLQYALLDKEPMDSDRFAKLQDAVKLDVELLKVIRNWVHRALPKAQ